MAVCSGPLFAQTWDGGGNPNFNWTVPANWSPDGVPANNGTANLVFAGFTGLSPNVDTPFFVNTIQFNTPSTWVLQGQPVTLNSGITAVAPATINNSLVLNPANGTVSFSTGTLVNLVLANAGASTLNLGVANLSLVPASSITIGHAIIGSGSVSKSSAGTVVYSGSAINSYTGPTTVIAGSLQLQRPAGGLTNNFGSAIQGALNINGGEVRLGAAEQISDTAPVTLAGAGVLNVATFSEAVGSLAFSAGGAVIGGGTLRIAGGAASTVAVTGATGVATISANLNAGSVARAFDVSTTLNLNGGLVAPAGFVKLGAGTLFVGGAFLPSGPVNLRQGSLVLSPGNVNFFSAVTPVTVGLPDGSSPDGITLSVIADSFAPAPSSVDVTVNPGGTFAASGGFNPTVSNLGRLTLSSRSTAAFAGFEHTVSPRAVSANATLASNAPTFTASRIDFGNSLIPFTTTFSGAASPSANHFTVTAQFTSGPTGGLVVTGNGKTTLVPQISIFDGGISNLIVRSAAVDIDGSSGGALLSPGASIIIDNNATLRLVSGGIISGFSSDSLSSITVNPLGTLVFTNAQGDSVQTLNLFSGRFDSDQPDLSVTTINAAQVPGSPVPSITNSDADSSVTIPFDGDSGLTINVMTTTNVASTSTGDFNLFAGINGSSQVTKTGPGNLYWKASDFDHGGNFTVASGVLTLELPDPDARKFDGRLIVGDGTGAPALANLVNDAVNSNFGDIVVRRGGTLRLLADAASDDFTLAGGTVTSTGATTVFSPYAIVTSAGVTTASLLDVDVRLDISRITLGQSSTLVLNRRVLFNGSSAFMNVGGPGTLLVTNSAAGSAFPGELYIFDGASIILDRSNAPQFTGPLFIVGTGSNLTVRRAGQLPTGSPLSMSDGGSLVFQAPSAESFGAMSVTSPALVSGVGASQSSLAVLSLNISPGTTATGSASFTGLTLTVSGPTSVTATGVSFGGPTNLLGTLALVSGATAVFGGPSLVTGPITLDASTLLATGGTLETRSVVSVTNSVVSVAAGATLMSRGSLAGSYRLEGAGTFDNRGTLFFPNNSDLDVPPQFSLRNAGSLGLGGRNLTAASFTNAPSGVLSGPGLLILSSSFSNAGTLVAPSGVTSFLNPFTNAGTTRLTSPTASLAAPAVLNTGRITGDGILAVDLLTNRGTVEPSQLGQLLVSGRLSNSSTGTLSLPALTSLVLSDLSDPNAGLVSLAGGSLQALPNSPGAFTNAAQGRINGFGTVTLPALRNSGAITFAGGTTVVNSPVTNDIERTLRIQAGTAIFNYPVTNNGGIVVGPGGQAVFAADLGALPADAPTPAALPVAVAGSGGSVVSPGALLQTDGIRQASLSLLGTAASPSTVFVTSREPSGAIVAPGRLATHSLSILNSISVANDAAPLGSRNYHGLVELTTNDLLLRSSSPASDLAVLHDLARAYLQSSGTRGLGAASGHPQLRLAIFPNDLSLTGGSPDPAAGGGGSSAGLIHYPSFDGLPAQSNDLFVRLTYIGDTNIDGILDARDLTNLIEGFSTIATGWHNGDFDYSGSVTVADFAAFQQARAAFTAGQLPDLGSPLSNGGGGAIPEPGAIGLLVVPLLAATRRRR